MNTMRTKGRMSTGVKVTFILMFFALLVLGACNPSENTGYRIQTYTPTASATPTCKPGSGILTPANWEKSPSQLIVVLYDPRFYISRLGDSDNGQYLELLDGEKTRDIPYFLSRVVPALMKPSDQVAIFELGYSSFDNARVGRLRSELTPPPLYNTPAPPKAVTPAPTLGTPTPGFEWVARVNAYQGTSTAVAETATESAQQYNCTLDYYNHNILLTSVAYDTASTAEANRVITELGTGLAVSSTPRIISNEKQFGTNELYYGGVYYGLSFATTIFQSQCNKYDNCLLYIVSDMHYYGLNNPDKLPIDLKGVHTYVIMPSCLDLDEGNCKERVEYWSSEFSAYGSVAPFFSAGLDDDKNFQNFLKNIGR